MLLANGENIEAESTIGYATYKINGDNSITLTNMEKDTGLILKAIDGQIEDANGNKTDVIVEYNYEFGNVDENIFTEPNISDYKIQENN